MTTAVYFLKLLRNDCHSSEVGLEQHNGLLPSLGLILKFLIRNGGNGSPALVPQKHNFEWEFGGTTDFACISCY